MTGIDRNDALFFSLVLDDLNDGILLLDADRRVVRVNQALQKLLGVRQEDVAGADASGALSGPLARTLGEAAAQRILKSPAGAAGQTYRICSPDGTVQWFSVTVKPPVSGLQAVIVRDVTAAEDLRRFRTALDHSPVVVFAQDTDLRYTWTYNQQFGVTDASVIGKTDADLFLPEDAASLAALKRRVLETGEVIRREVLLTIGGTLHVRDMTLEPLLDAECRPCSIVGAAYDVTSQKRNERALRESEARFRGIFEDAGVGILLADLDGSIIESNPALQEMLGYTGEELSGTAIEEITHPEDAPAAASSYAGMRAGRLEQFRSAKRYVTKSGSVLWVRVIVSLLRDADGHPHRIIAMVENITGQKHLEQHLAYQASLLERVNDAIIATDEHLIVTAWNRAAEELYGYSADEACGRPVQDLFSPAKRIDDLGGIVRLVESTGQHRTEVVHHHRDGRPIYLESSITPLRDAEGRVTGYISVNRDILERKMAEKIKRQAFGQIEQNMEQFAILGDHIRHPLQVIQARADLLDDPEISASVRDQVRRINDIIRQLDKGWIESRKIREFLLRNELI
ncbi:PAS domain S-box protein [Methanoculleus sp. FWC-SCC1]|uniref:PAS domain S-box protein n=1 Tax=Methanoculleus frigidifontis TaxID=2584085 RepID=A0ABT8MD18_9EURY|nr:PAS domain S-box protein [Methanoculleus sp. FWC-SCC1]MDN7025839.1 PAS domain S-box protein [Methanoculleus sp. FWC-SCC1]